MTRLRFVRPAAALAAATALAAFATPSLGQSAREPDAPRLYRVEVIVFGYEAGDPTEELFAHTAARAAMQSVEGDAAIETFDFAPYLPPSGDDAFGDDTASERGRDRRLLGAEEAAGEEAGAGSLADGGADPSAETPLDDASASETSADEADAAEPFWRMPADAAEGFRFRLLAPDELELVDARRRLERLDAYTPLVHGGWVQEGLALRDARPFDLAYLGASNPVGTIRLHLSRYLHLAVDLVYRPGMRPPQPAAGSAFPTSPQALSDVPLPARYVLRAERRIGSGVVQYFDHPMFGVLVLVRPYEPPARTASDSGPAA